MTETETRYAQIDKETLATTWACEKFSTYVLGSKFLIETDHKPLVQLLGSKNLDNLPPRILRFRLRLARFDYNICHVPGKLLYPADCLEPPQKTKETMQNSNEMLRHSWKLESSTYQSVRADSNSIRKHKTKTIPQIPDDTDVRVTTGNQPATGTVLQPANTPQSYIVNTPTGQVRCNRQHLNVIPPDLQSATNQERNNSTRDPIITGSRSGTTIYPPDRL